VVLNIDNGLMHVPKHSSLHGQHFLKYRSGWLLSSFVYLDIIVAGIVVPGVGHVKHGSWWDREKPKEKGRKVEQNEVNPQG
jgi:hypothetical protein